MYGYDSDYDYECETCDRTFRTPRACEQHMAALNHWTPVIECDTCTRTFASNAAAHQHMNACAHWPYNCDWCYTGSRSKAVNDNHMAVCSNRPAHYCRDCQRSFDSANNLRMHLNSKIHRGSDVPCPFCRRGFTTASGVAHHLETSSCPKASNINRDQVYRAIREHDTYGNFTHKQLEWKSPEYTPSRSWDPSNAWNGSSYECYLCHKGFHKTSALLQHIKSPAHQQKRYKCPKASCHHDFVTLAALFNHLESETCGAMRFETVVQTVNNLFSGVQTSSRSHAGVSMIGYCY